MKIVIIDDSPDALAVAKTRLAHEGHEILCAAGGGEGLETVGREKPDLILLDVDMPGMSGFDVCRWLKDDAATCSIPVIFLSGSNDIGDKVKGLDLGAVDFVTKPFDAFELRARVRAALRTKHLQDLLRRFALIDPLTELPNRRALDDRLAQEWARLLRHGGDLSVIMVDIDRFKSINDRFGHPAGDEVLRQVACLMAACCRETDTPARYGGDEFAVLAPETPTKAAMDFAERLQKSVCSQPLTVHGNSVNVTVSLGVAGHEGINSPEELIHAADQALYLAKSAGRNCVMGSVISSTTVP
ncbi:MAG: diguanylate cyclase [Phycisphaerae bacterium]|jgi:diguanylate cyclase (GGDEF)-like protein